MMRMPSVTEPSRVLQSSLHQALVRGSILGVAALQAIPVWGILTSDVRLGGGEHRGQRPAEALLARGEQDVPGQRVDRRACDHADPVQVAVGGSHDREVDGHDQDDGGAEQRRREVSRYGRRRDLVVGERRRDDGVPWALAG